MGALPSHAQEPSWFDAKAMPGHTIRYLGIGTETYEERIRLIRGARKSVYVAMFATKNDVVSANFMVELCKKAQEGRDVRVALSVHSSKLVNEPMSATPGLTDDRSWKRWFFEDCGGYMIFDRQSHQGIGDAPFAAHEKLVIVDGEHYTVGGSGIANYYYQASRESEKWHDQDLSISGPTACYFHRAFAENWRRMAKAAGRLKSERAIEHYWSPSTLASCEEKAFGESRVYPSYNNPLFSRARPHLDAHLAAIGASRSEIVLYAPFFVPHAKTVKALLAARKRGVKVTIITNAPWNRGTLHEVHAAMYDRIGPLLKAKVRIRMWKPKSHMHRKGGYFDGKWVYLGSDNQDIRGQEFSSEAIAYTDDPAIVARVAQEIREDLDLTFALTPKLARQFRAKLPKVRRLSAKVIGRYL